MSNQETTISLESYAAVMAGLGAGLSLPQALAHADVLPSIWDRASEHWQSQIDESAASDLALLVAFDAALLAARRRFEPTLEPIESDPRAWAHFRRHFVTSVDPAAFLAERGLSLGIYARIEADWANRLLNDDALAAAFKGHMEAPLEECPALTLIPSPLLPARGAEPPAPPAKIPARVAPVPSPTRSNSPLPYSPSVPSAPPMAALPPMLHAPAEVSLHSMPSTDPGATMTGEIDLTLVRAALPFAPGAAPGPAVSENNPSPVPVAVRAAPVPTEPAPELPRVAAVRRPEPLDLSATMTLPTDLVASVQSSPVPHAVMAAPEHHPTTGAVGPELVNETIDLSSIAHQLRAAEKALPFQQAGQAPAPKAPPSIPTEPPAAIHRATQYAGHVKKPEIEKPADVGLETADISEIVALAREITPFERRLEPSANEKRAGEPPRDAQFERNMAAQAVSQVGALPSPAAPRLAANAPPFVAPEPSLSLEQYASLCVELSIYPTYAAAILQKYGLMAEQKGRVDHYWQDVFMAQPSQRVAWERACVAYRTWLVNKGSK